MKQTLKGIKVYKLWHGGIGIGSLPDGKKILIKGWALPWSIVDVKVVKKRKDFIEAHIIETKKYNPQIADGEIFCPHYFIPKWKSAENAGTAKIGCGGCKWQMISYEKQLELKQQLVEESFKKVQKQCRDIQSVHNTQHTDTAYNTQCRDTAVLRCPNPATSEVAKTVEIKFLPIISSPLTQRYRNKIEFSFGVYKQQSEAYRERQKQQIQYEKQQIQCRDVPIARPNTQGEFTAEKYTINNQRGCGFHKQGEFSKIVDVDTCGLISAKANQIFQTIKKLCFESGLPVYDQKTHQGFFRHLVLREGVNTNQLMVNLSVALANLNDEQTKIRESLLEQFKQEKNLTEQITTFVITYNESLADTVKNEKSETKVFWGEGYIYEKLHFG